MRDLKVKDEQVEEKLKDSKTVDDSVGKMIVKNITTEEEKADSDITKTCENEDNSEQKELNFLSEGLGKLNIENEDGHDEKNDSVSSVDEYIKRGPTGGIPSQQHALLIDKTLPIGPTGNYMPPQMVYQQPQMKGNRRTLDEAEDQPQKFFRPPMNFQYGNMPGIHGIQEPTAFLQQYGTAPQFQPNFAQNDLNQRMMNPPMFNFGSAGNQGFPFGEVTTTDVRSTSNMSGGKVTVQSPVSNVQNPFPQANFADELLEEIAEQQKMSSVNQGNLPNFTNGQLGSNTTWETGVNNFEGKSFKEMRRISDPDSGIDSESGSPWSEQAPSPSSSVYTSPPSVESGVGHSPMHESQFQHGMSPPKYHGVTSPGNYRATPSPANTSGYGSPGQPQLEDTGDYFNEALLEDALAVINADMISEEHKKKRQLSSSSQPPVPVMMPNRTNINQPTMINTSLPQGMVPQSGMVPQTVRIPQIQNPAMLPNQGIIPVTSAPQQIIILPPQQQTTNQPVILVPVCQTSPAPPKKTGTQYKKILPKISPTSSSSPGSNMSKSGQTSVAKTPNAGMQNRNQQSQQAMSNQQNKLLMIARRTVADIPREDLRKSDDEGDTYLHIAVCKTDRHMVQALLERLHREKLENLVDQENLKRQTPLYLAVFINQFVMVAMFIKFQANVNVLAQNLSSDGATTEVKSAIHVAASQGADYLRTLTELLKAKDIQINIVNNYGQTALHCAILAHGKPKRNGQDRIDSVAIIQTLIKHGADPSAQDKKSGKTPLMYAIEQKNLELVDTILRSVHPDKVKNVVKTQAFDGSTCLKLAESLKGSIEVEIWNRLWNSLQSAANGSMARYHMSPPVIQAY